MRKGQSQAQGESSTSEVRRRVDFPSEDDEAKDSDDEVMASDNLTADECEDIGGIPKCKDSFKAGKWHDFIDEDDDSNYYQALYKNGELFEDKKFGCIKLRPWMIFMDKKHFKDTLKDYAIQEGFAINVLAADNKRYTGTCYAENCSWRIHASRLPDEKTWAIKKIEPSVHTCRGLETYNPLCDVKWASAKLMEDIRANPDIPGKALNELLFQRYGIYMKQSTLYTMKNYTVDKLFGGHDESYRDIPAYTRIICDTNPESKAYSSYVESESIPRQLLFSSVFISLTAMWKGFLAGCRPLIGVDGTHLKGNYGGVLLSAVALDANNEIFPVAYAVVSVEDKDNWSYFLWNIYNIVKESSRKDWTIISDRQKV